MPDNLAVVEQASVQEHQPKSSLGASFIWFGVPGVPDGDLLPAFGLHARDRYLRALYRGPYAWIAQAAVAALVKKVKQTPWLIEGGRNLRGYYQDVFANADFGEGWGQFISRVLLDFLTCDYGAYIEVIGRGRADGPLRGRVLGLAHLDSLRCIPTGNPEWPVVYWSRGVDPKKNSKGVMHRLHRSRVIRLVDMPDGDERLFGPGLCALSRAISMLALQEPMQRYVVGQLNDVPPAGILYNWGLTDEQFHASLKEYNLKRKNGYKGVMTISDVAKDGVGGNFVGFSTAPEGFKYPEYTELAVNVFAATFGIDRQDIWPLTGKMAGTATQSEVMDEKAKGMAYGDILQALERAFNWKVLPRAAEFSFKRRDDEADQKRASRLQAVVSVAETIKRLGFSDDVVGRFLAAQSEEIRDIITDEEGEIAELPDNDPREEEPVVTAGEPASTADESAPADESDNAGDKAAKEVQSLRLDFENSFADILASARAGEINRRRAGILIRGLIQRSGRLAYIEGLKDGGVPDAELDAEDRARINLLTADQSVYVTAFLDTLYADGISDAIAANKPAQWWGGSIQPFYDAGRLSADRNGNYECVGPVDDHSCKTCKAAAGQVHRFKSWAASGLLFPHGSAIMCSPGKLCRHTLVRTNKPAQGRLSLIPRREALIAA